MDKGSSVVDRGVVDSHGSIGGGVVGHGSGGVDSSHRLLVVAVAVHRLGRGVGLARHGGVVGAVGLVDGHGDGGGVAVLDNLVVGLVGGHNGQQGSTDKRLKQIFVNVRILQNYIVISKSKILWKYMMKI